MPMKFESRPSSFSSLALPKRAPPPITKRVPATYARRSIGCARFAWQPKRSGNPPAVLPSKANYTKVRLDDTSDIPTARLELPTRRLPRVGSGTLPDSPAPVCCPRHLLVIGVDQNWIGLKTIWPFSNYSAVRSSPLPGLLICVALERRRHRRVSLLCALFLF
jgi:hypothetical protein